MHTRLAFCWTIVMSLACAQRNAVGFSEPLPRVAQDTLSISERARIVEALVSFRQLIFLNDTTAGFDGCSIQLAVGPQYRQLLRADVRKVISQPSGTCVMWGEATVHSPTLLLKTIRGAGDEATVLVTYRGPGTNPHEEEYKLRRPSGRSNGLWTATEVRIFGVLIVD